MRAARDQRPPVITAEFEALFEEARALEKNPPRKHHLIADTYLKRWAVGGRLRVTETRSRYTYKTSPAKAGRETDFYRIEHPGLDSVAMPPFLFEHLLSRIEGKTVPAIEHLVAVGFDGLSPEDGFWLATYMAFQLTRGRAFRAEQQAITQELFRLENPSTESRARRIIEQVGEEPTPERVADTLGFLRTIQDGSRYVSQEQAGVIGMAGQVAEGLVPHLLFRDWFVFRSDWAPIITCDEPVVAIDGPGGDRRERGGFGTAGVIVFPLAPNAVLAMFHPDAELDDISLHPDLNPNETDELNLEIAANSHRWMFERPDRTRSCTLALPPLQPASAMEGPLALADRPGELYRTYKPSRWHTSPNPPSWPISRWWPNQAA